MGEDDGQGMRRLCSRKEKSLPYNMEQKFRMDGTAYKATTAAEADDHVTYWTDRSLRERLEAACYLINQAYGTTPQTKLDRAVFSKRKFNHSYSSE